MTDMRIEVFQNEFLAEGATTVDAVVTVTAGEPVEGKPAAVVPGSGAAEIIMIDCSGSMYGEKIRAARNAAAVALDTLRDGVAFAIVVGTHNAQSLYPGGNQLAIASPKTRDEAKNAVKRLGSGGGTNFSAWLHLTNRLFTTTRAAIKHAILLTDGENGDRPAEFRKAVNACVGQFVCDSRGVGDGWLARDLVAVSEALLGTADAMKDPSRLEEDFRSMVETAMGKTVADVSLRLWTPAGAKLRFVKQVFPEIVDLTGRRTEVSARIGDYPTGSWGAESRDYHVSVEVEAGPVGEEVLGARVSMVHGDDVLAQGLVRAVWTDDLEYSTRINGRVAHYTGQTELNEAIQEGIKERAAGNLDKATARLARAVQLARESGREDTVKLLKDNQVVEIVDDGTEGGTVRVLRPQAGGDIGAEISALDSRKTVRVRKKD
jgi:hypothetical protein